MVKRLKFKRRFLNLTNYAKRKVFVESGKLRLVVRFSNRYILAQIIKAEIRGDNCLVSVHSSELKKLGWPFSLKNIPASYLVGYMIGKKALKKRYRRSCFRHRFKNAHKRCSCIRSC
jgi:large subunit ribosomal protein L18